MTRRGSVLALLLAGFLGPFGGQLLHVMLTEVGDRLQVSEATVTLGITWYMIPFAGLMILSGSIAAVWGPVRTVRIALAVYGIGSIVCALAPTLLLFLVGRVIQGAANAFTTPVLIVLLVRTVQRDQVGRALGTFAAAQSLGQGLAPLLGGAAAAVDYRLAFVGLTLVSLAIVPAVHGDDTRTFQFKLAALRKTMSVALGRACVAAFSSQLGVTSLTMMTSLIAADRFGFGPIARGLIISCFGLGGFMSVRGISATGERSGVRRLSALGAILLVAVLALGGWAPTGWSLIVAMFGLGVAWTALRVFYNYTAIASTPTNPTGATSFLLSAQFMGSALAPLLVPLMVFGSLTMALAAIAVVIVGNLMTIGLDPEALGS